MPKTLDSLDFIGAGARIRTAGFLITSEILYQLSYAGTTGPDLYQGGPGNSRVLTPILCDVAPLFPGLLGYFQGLIRL